VERKRLLRKKKTSKGGEKKEISGINCHSKSCEKGLGGDRNLRDSFNVDFKS